MSYKKFIKDKEDFVHYGTHIFYKPVEGVAGTKDNHFVTKEQLDNSGGGGGGDASTLNGESGSFYRNRENHTGTQPVSTITGLGTAATANSTEFATAAQGALAETALQSFTEEDPTVPAHVKAITTANITTWNGKQNALSIPSQAEVEAGTSTTARSITAQRIRQGADAAKAAKEWHGTRAAYEAITTPDPLVDYFIEKED